jgi:hypothetical protein
MPLAMQKQGLAVFLRAALLKLPSQQPRDFRT